MLERGIVPKRFEIRKRRSAGQSQTDFPLLKAFASNGNMSEASHNWENIPSGSARVSIKDNWGDLCFLELECKIG
jgi:hypothetical protein